MNHALSLILELVEQAAWGLHIRASVRNDSAAKLFLPFPEIIGLRFGNVDTHHEAQWYTRKLVSTSGGGFVLRPGASQSFEWRVRPCSVEPPSEVAGGSSDWNYQRWCIALEPGTYLVWWQWRVGEDFFDPDSHMRLPDLVSAAAQEQAEVWLGHALSNRLRVVFAEPAAPGR